MRFKIIILGSVLILFMCGMQLIAQDKDQASQQTDKTTILREMKEVDIEYTYIQDDKRDPFKAPKIGPPENTEVEQTELQGIAKDPKGNYVAILLGPGKKIFRKMVGDKFLDGEVLSIDHEKVVFKVKAKDDIKSYITVTKWLHPENGVQ